MIEVNFIYRGNNTTIQCYSNDKIKTLMDKFIAKAEINDLNKIFFLYSGKIINENHSLREIIGNNYSQTNKINILVNDKESSLNNKEKITLEKSKNIICPKCGEISLISINDYKIKIYGCKNGHEVNDILFKTFENTQKIDISKIICDICKQNNKADSYNKVFYSCQDCKKNICVICKLAHDKNHKIIDHEYKDFICFKHNESYCRYCKDCNINFCLSCEPKHENHNSISLMMDLDKIKGDVDNMRKILDEFNNNINNIIKKLKKVSENLEIYYKVYTDLITNYENKKRNNEIIHNIKELNGNKILKDISSINNENNLTKKINNILEIYKKMNVDKISIKYIINKKDKIKIFGKGFVINNKSICKIIYEDKEYELQEFFDTTNINKEILEIKLKGINEITDMAGLFDRCNSLSPLSDISKWDTSNIINMSYIFSNCNFLEFLPDISSWNTSNVKYMNGIFRGCTSLKELPDISNWDTSNVIYIGGIYAKYSSLTPLSFKEIKSFINDNKKYIIGGLFYECNSLKSLPNISKWKTNKVVNMSFIFDKCYLLSSLPDISKWDISNINDLSCVFSCCKSLKTLPNISKWDTSNCTTLNGLFYECKSLLSLPDISKWNISKVIDFHDIFNGCESLSSFPDISFWNTSNVIDMAGIFGVCKSLTSLPDISKWDTYNCINMSLMFANCGSLRTLPDISKWNTANVKDMSNMFNFCDKISSLPNISKWNVSNVNNMSGMFGNCSLLCSLPDISKWNIKEGTNIDNMFQNCKDNLNIPYKFKK